MALSWSRRRRRRWLAVDWLIAGLVGGCGWARGSWLVAAGAAGAAGGGGGGGGGGGIVGTVLAERVAAAQDAWFKEEVMAQRALEIGGTRVLPLECRRGGLAVRHVFRGTNARRAKR